MNNMEKVYRVTVSKEVWVLANSHSEAELEAKFYADDDIAAWNSFAVEVKTIDKVPDKMKNVLLWGTDDEITIVEALDKIKASSSSNSV